VREGGGRREELTYNVRVYTCYVERGEEEESVFILYLLIYTKRKVYGRPSKNFGSKIKQPTDCCVCDKVEQLLVSISSFLVETTTFSHLSLE
jgi:hypothetical protein